MSGSWHFIHGHSGSIEDPRTITGFQAKGWGLSFHLAAGAVNWIHYAVPSNALFNWRVDYLHLQFTLGEHALATEVHLWDGPLQFWQQPLGYVEAEVDVMLELGNEWLIQRALGVSVKIEAARAGDAHFMFHAIGANFRQ